VNDQETEKSALCSKKWSKLPNGSKEEEEEEEYGGDTLLRNVGSHKIYTVPHPRRRHSSK
jgi:hypothetical protein